MQRALIVPAAGLGTRLKSELPKALTAVGGRAMLDHLFERFSPWADSVVVVAHPSFVEALHAHVEGAWSPDRRSAVVEQANPTGMLDAILLAAPLVRSAGAERVWIVWCDQVGILESTLERLAHAERARPSPRLVFPTVPVRNPYIHFPRDESGRITGVLQRREGDRMPASGESDMGLFSLATDAYLSDLTRYAADLAPGASTAERNFLPFIPWLAARGRVDTIDASDPREAVGINTPEELRFMEDWLQSRAAHR